MTRYLAKRLALSVIVLWGLASVTFLTVHLVPGDPVRQALGPRASAETIKAVRHQLSLDRPLPAQYLAYMNDLIHGNLGTSLSLSAPVSHVLSQRVAPSILLIGYGLIFALAIGVPLAIAAALRPNGVIDHTVRLTTTFLFGMPTFWLGLMVALLFGLKLRWFPVSGYRTGPSGVLQTLTLPALTLGLSMVVIVTRTLRSNLIDTLKSEYVEAARSRGMSEFRIVTRHAMRNAVMPTLTILSAVVGYLIGGTVVIEAVFQIPGAGSLLVHSILAHDNQIVQAIALASGVAVVAISLATDLLQAALDPRVRLQR